MIADTSFIIDIMDGDALALQKLSVVEKGGTPLNVTALTVFELWSGIARSKKKEDEKKKVRGVLLNQSVVDFDRFSAELAGSIHGELFERGTPIGSVDSMIAGIARMRGEKILTRNVKHFQRAGVDVEMY